MSGKKAAVVDRRHGQALEMFEKAVKALGRKRTSTARRVSSKS